MAGSRNGQVAVILILVVAAALIFYAVSLNLGRISQTKVVTTIAADTGASLLASHMASYGQQIFQTTLGGDRNQCGLTGVVAAIVTVVLAIIAVVAALYGQFYITAAVIAFLATAALVLQVAVIQPGLTDAINEKMNRTMDQVDSFVERGIQKALSSVVTDGNLVPDFDDSDGDRLWGFDANGQPLDRIGRFGFYITKQRIDMIPPPLSTSMADFVDALRNFLLDDGDNWGIFDHTGPICASSECYHCCVPPITWTEEMGCAANVSVNPFIYTPNPVDVANVRAICEAGSPYGNGISSNYPWVYDAHRGNPGNAFVSFQEQLGRDDEHRGFEKAETDPNGIQVLAASPPTPANIFQLVDTTGFYTPPVYPAIPPEDDRTGIFPLFYKTADWGVNLNPSLLVTNDPANPQCHWCAPGGPSTTTCSAAPGVHPLEIPQLALPLDPLTLTYNRTFCVDGINLVPGNPPLAVDLVRLPDAATGLIEAADNQCAQNAWGQSNTGFWKRGGDRFCSGGTDACAAVGDCWPYYEQCAKYGTCTVDGAATGCACGTGNAVAPEDPDNGWPDDLVDDVLYGLNLFIDFGMELLNKSPEELAKNFKLLYPQIAQWIEPGPASVPPPSNRPDCANCCYVCGAKDGALHIWHKEIQEIRDRLLAWRDTSFAGSQCREVWCVPPADYSSCSSFFPTLPPASEEATFNINGNSVRGDIEDIVACINWNANDNTVIWADGTPHNQYSDGTPVLPGNAAKFQACAVECATAEKKWSVEKCSNLPRSLVPLVDTRIPDQDDLKQLEHCRNSCSNAHCQPMNPSYFTGIPGTGNPGTTDFEAGIPSLCSTWGAGNAWYDRIAVKLAELCDPVADGWLDGIIKSIPEAKNQVAKFRQRHAFLSGRLREMNEAIFILDAADAKFNEFLTCVDGDSDGDPDGAACKLIKDRINLDTQETGLPYQAIYGWQSADEPGQPPGLGNWHIARVDARIPGRCDRACNEAQDPALGDPAWPWVESETEGFLSSRRCFELRSTEGIVKVRVTRFDESSAFATLLFPNAVEIWKPTFDRSDRPQTGLSNPNNIESACSGSMMPDPAAGPSACPGNVCPGSHFYGAFMLNERLFNMPDPGCMAACGADSTCQAGCPNIDNSLCWDLASRLLSRGVTSERCARYYYHEGTPKGLDFQFVPCSNF